VLGPSGWNHTLSQKTQKEGSMKEASVSETRRGLLKLPRLGKEIVCTPEGKFYLISETRRRDQEPME